MIFVVSIEVFVMVVSLSLVAHAQVDFASEKDLARGSVEEGVSSLIAGDLNSNGRGDVVVIEGGKHASGRKHLLGFSRLFLFKVIG